jgi:hypothetical protein
VEVLKVTGNVHRSWAAFLCGYRLLQYLLPTKNAQCQAVLPWYTIQGRRHLVTAAPSLQSCAYRSLRVAIKLDSAAN